MAASMEKEDTMYKFELEVLWCINQLELGVQNSKGGPKQVQSSLKLIKVLRNPKTPMVKKRQVMNKTFGDYRKKMADEQKKYGSSVKKMSINPISSKSAQSTYYKRSTQKPDSNISESDKETPVQNSINLAIEMDKPNSSYNYEPPSKEFKFNFQVQSVDAVEAVDEDIGADVKSIEETLQQATLDAESNDNMDHGSLETGTNKVQHQPSEKYYTPSDNAFRFNFPAPDPS
ncbi:unnamed protein product [Owenia fusiformis]|uniref:Uncharacterized protein n=1 Tax=Owenia fusiformis TaxID=6347 RepID=A0A8S4N371_OWEFU|nr:unnamed protein product [Owenia fusiformis]